PVRRDVGCGLHRVLRHRRPAVLPAGANPEMTRLALAFLFALPVIAQQPTFRAATEMGRLDTLVERDGQPVTNLTADDFTVLDNGAPQRIVTIKQMEAVGGGVSAVNRRSVGGDAV